MTRVDAEGFELASQGYPRDSQDRGGLELVARSVGEDLAEEL